MEISIADKSNIWFLYVRSFSQGDGKEANFISAYQYLYLLSSSELTFICRFDLPVIESMNKGATGICKEVKLVLVPIAKIRMKRCYVSLCYNRSIYNVLFLYYSG